MGDGTQPNGWSRSKNAHRIFVAAPGTPVRDFAFERSSVWPRLWPFTVVNMEGLTRNAPQPFWPSNKTPCSPNHRDELAFNFWIVSHGPRRRLRFQTNVNRMDPPSDGEENAAEFFRDPAPGSRRIRGLAARPPQDRGGPRMRWGRSHGGGGSKHGQGVGESPRRERHARPRNFSGLPATHEMSGVTRDLDASRRAYSSRYTTRPPTIVPTTLPVNCQPSNGEFRDNERDFVTSNVHRFLGSKIVRSP